MKKHIIFDLDGTLVNSFPIMEDAWNIVRNKFNLKITFQEYKKYTGLPFDIIMDRLNLSKINNEIKKLYFNETKKRAKKIKLIKGAKELISYLSKKEYFVSIITSKPRKSYDAMKTLIPKSIGAVLCSDDTNFNKPDKKLIQYLLSKHSDKIQNLTYIGDTIFDLQFSINSNIDFIHFTDNKKNILPKNLVNKIKTVDTLLEIKKIF